jgi:iron(III) transport system permease protein
MRHGIWPQAGPTACSGAYIVFLLCLWDVETAVLIQPPGGQTLALRIFNFLHYGHSTQVNALCIIVLCIAILPILGWKWLPFSPGPAINRAADSL